MRAAAITLFAFFLVGAPALGSAGEDAKSTTHYETLRKAGCFAIGLVGEAGGVSEEEKALRALLLEFGSTEQFRRLLTEATPAGQLYALLGLRLQDPEAFREVSPKYAMSFTSVVVMSGCVSRSRLTMEIFDLIRDGKIY